MIEYFPTHTLPPHQQVLNIIELQLKEQKEQGTHSEEDFLGKPQNSRGRRSKDIRGSWSLWPLQLQKNIKCSPTPSQININPHSHQKPFTSGPITR